MEKDIYIIKNNINKKVYIGQAIDVAQRFQSHCKPSSANTDGSLISLAIQKYGKTHFWYEILEKATSDYNEREIYWIKHYNSLAPNGYNILKGGEKPPIFKGENHPESALSASQVKDLTKDLLFGRDSFVVLAEKYGFKSNTSVSEFNKGVTYHREIKYPLREDPHNGKLSLSDIDNIINQLKFSYLSFEAIAAPYRIEARAISRINKGLLHKRTNESYPIREWEATRIPLKLTYDEVTEVINLLMNTNESLRAIARRFKVGYRDILNIKNGETKAYRRRGLTYPLRKNN